MKFTKGNIDWGCFWCTNVCRSPPHPHFKQNSAPPPPNCPYHCPSHYPLPVPLQLPLPLPPPPPVPLPVPPQAAKKENEALKGERELLSKRLDKARKATMTHPSQYRSPGPHGPQRSRTPVAAGPPSRASPGPLKTAAGAGPPLQQPTSPASYIENQKRGALRGQATAVTLEMATQVRCSPHKTSEGEGEKGFARAGGGGGSFELPEGAGARRGGVWKRGSRDRPNGSTYTPSLGSPSLF